MDPLSKMKLRLYLNSILIGIAAPASYVLLAWGLPAYFANVPMLLPLAQSAAQVAPLVAAVMIAAALALAGYSNWRIMRWEAGSHPECPRCGGLTVEETRRGGYYQHCLLCNQNSRIH